MSFHDETESDRRRKPDPESDTPAEAAAARARKRRPVGEVGDALRSAYQRMVDEDIPPEMLDLLGKLG